MFRIDNDTAIASLPTPGAAGTPGYFTGGNPGTGQEATVVTADFLNAVQEELINVLDEAGISPDKASLTQLYDSLVALGLRSATDALAGIVELATAAEAKAGTDTQRALTPASIASIMVPAGAVMPFAMDTAPAGWEDADGSSLDLKSASTYHDLFDAIGLAYTADAGEEFTADAGTDEIQDADHALIDGDCVVLRNSGGALPAGLSASTRYFVVNSAAGGFQLAATPGGAPVDITDAGTGTHTYLTSFRKPDLRGYFVRGWDNGAGNDPDAASRTDRGDGTTGDEVGTKQDDELESHTHNYLRPDTSSGQYGSLNEEDGVKTRTSIATSAAGGNETRPKNIALLYCIKI